jgi:4-amino-4-deoxy-L-arabinose transferase-like glycosyltransferase
MWRGAVLVLLCTLTFLTGLGQTAIQDSDEAYYAEAGREMLVSGDWITPYYNFEPRLDKPILLYWLIAASYAAVGVSEAAARFWPALSGMGVAFVAFLAGSRWVGRDAGWLAGVIVATSFGVVPFARQSLPDMPLAIFVSVSVWAAIEGLGAPVAGAETTRLDRMRPGTWLSVAAVAAALGTLTKGPVAVVLLLTVLLPLLWWESRVGVSRGTRPGVTAAQIALAVGLFLLVAAPWYVAVTLAQGPDYLHQFLVGENVDRFTTSQYNLWRGHFYFPIIAGGLLPWSVFGALWLRPAAAVLARRRALSVVERRLVCWAAGPLAFFMLSIGSQPRYILPCLVPLAILLARSVHVRSAAGRGRDWVFTATTLVSGVVIVAVGLLILRAAPLLSAANPGWSSAGPLAIVVAGGAVMLWSLVGFRRWAPALVAVAAAVAVVVFERSVLAPGRPEPVEVIAAAARASGITSQMCACGALARSLTFYTHVKTYLAATDRGDADVEAFLASPGRVLAAVDSHVLARVEARLGRRVPRLVEVDYLSATVRQQPATLLRPDPGLLQHLVVVSNR